MKVSRKVGRRKHSRGSSISRRRLRNKKNSKNKSSYKKRYAKTHKGGCWSAKKGGARSRRHGHKRGKRFHRGGHNFDYFLDTEFSKPIISVISKNAENPSDIYRLSNDLKLKYNKVSYISVPTTSSFSLTFYILLDFHDINYEPKVCMTLTRSGTDGQDSLIFVKFGTLTDVLEYLKQFYLSESITESGYMFNSSGSLEKKNPNDKEKNLKKYNFKYTKNATEVYTQSKLFRIKLEKLLTSLDTSQSKTLLTQLDSVEKQLQQSQSTPPLNSSPSNSTSTDTGNPEYSTDVWGGAQRCHPTNYLSTRTR
jgi:hypothetical protein